MCNDQQTELNSLSHRAIHAVGFLIVIKVGRQKRVVSETPFLFLMKIIVLYEGFNAVFESVQIDIAQISIDENLKHHAWVVRRTTFRRILTVKFFKVCLSMIR